MNTTNYLEKRIHECKLANDVVLYITVLVSEDKTMKTGIGITKEISEARAERESTPAMDRTPDWIYPLGNKPKLSFPKKAFVIKDTESQSITRLLSTELTKGYSACFFIRETAPHDKFFQLALGFFKHDKYKIISTQTNDIEKGLENLTQHMILSIYNDELLPAKQESARERKLNEWFVNYIDRLDKVEYNKLSEWKLLT